MPVRLAPERSFLLRADEVTMITQPITKPGTGEVIGYLCKLKQANGRLIESVRFDTLDEADEWRRGWTRRLSGTSAR
jgi:hypothetical protein